MEDSKKLNKYIKILPTLLPMGGVLNHLYGVIFGTSLFVEGSRLFHLSTLIIDAAVVFALLKKYPWGWFLGLYFFIFQFALQSLRIYWITAGEFQQILALQIVSSVGVGAGLVFHYLNKNDFAPEFHYKQILPPLLFTLLCIYGRSL